ncbi:uncharacterized protein LOC143869764 [Tasmannia lanceolata]|uniref:uncharacterized protein LOC143869764 n=1 Tax=Tasmannia lanceolata TaxID=3420 RepID=UPI004063576F
MKDLRKGVNIKTVKEVSSSRLSITQALEENQQPNIEIQKPCLVDGELNIRFDPERIQSSLHKWKNSLIGKISSTQIPCLASIKEKILLLWNPRGSLSIKFMGNDFILFMFEREDDLLDALNTGPCYISPFQILVLQRWDPEFNPLLDKIRKIPIWVRFPGLPMHMWEEYYVFSLAASIGKPLKMGENLIENGEARVCVEVDCSNPAPDGIWIGPKETGIWQQFKYEMLPKFCSVCDQFGHDVGNSVCPGMEKSTPKTNRGRETNKLKNHGTSVELGCETNKRKNHGTSVELGCETNKRKNHGTYVELGRKTSKRKNHGTYGELGCKTSKRKNHGTHIELGCETNKRKNHGTHIELGSDNDDDNGFGITPSCKTSKRDGSSQGEGSHSNKEFPKVDRYVSNGALGFEDNKEDKVKQSLRDGKEDAGKYKTNGKETLVDLKPRNGLNPLCISYPESEFYDFNKNREESNFAVDQVWTIFDDIDGMPRYHAYINKVFSPGFKVRITWLYPNPNPKNTNEIDWLEKKLPISCGNFKLNITEDTEEHLMFSHLASCKMDKARKTCKIYPRSGEIWALFKDWDFKWSSEPERHMQYEYEYVEVLSNYIEGTGIKIVPLVKVESFVSLFKRTVNEEMESVQILPTELFRFSHRIPSYRMTGREREEIPDGSFELDPASLPLCIEERHLDVGKTSSNDVAASHNSSLKKFSKEIENYPRPEFYKFEADTAKDKFQPGQIWALYSNIDGLPKYYAQIRKVGLADSKMQVTWLDPCPVSEDEKRWFKEDVPICCGTFQLQKGKSKTFSVQTFSHMVRAEPISDKSTCEIYPREGQVWAVYKNWRPGGALPELDRCEYEMVEILKETGPGLRVLVLGKVDGYKSVFEGIGLEKDIPRNELLRFSHWVSAFRLTKECGGKLRGYLELDPASVPTVFFRKTLNCSAI